MNEYEIDDAQDWFDPDDQPNLHQAVVYLARLRGWTNSRSDGWQYWAKPKQAATKLMALVLAGRERNYRNYGDLVDCTTVELTKALTPIKSLITREGDTWQQVLEQPAPDPLRELMRRCWNEGFAADAGATNPYA